MSSIKDKIVNKYVDEYLENSKQINYTDLQNKDGVTICLYKDLPKTEINGYPIASDYVTKDGKTYSMDQYYELDAKTKKNCQLRYYFLPNLHELYVGTTGSGKTTGCVEPQLRAISYQKNKPNLFITDPKGELFDHNAQHLINQGYKTFVLNFKELTRSDRWNPLLEIYDLKAQSNCLGDEAYMILGTPKPELKKMAPDKEFTSNEYVIYQDKAFPNEDAFNNYITFQKDYIDAQITSIVNQLANMFIKVQSTKDPTWEYGAQDLLKGIILCMLEDSVDESSGFTKDMMTISTIQQYYLALKKYFIKAADNRRGNFLKAHPLLKNKSDKTLALMSTALDNAPTTMRCYCGVFDSAVKDWFQGHIFALTTGNTIDIENIDDKPFAIFIITRDYEKSDFQVAGLFIDWVYRKMIEKAEKNKNTRPVHFLLDEFGNIPEIKDFENKIATSRSRNIWFHLVVQSYKQIDVVYGDNQSVIIRDNCNAQIFLGSQSRETKEIFSRECGKHNILSLSSKLNPNYDSLTEVPLLPVSNLELIKPGQMYLKRLYTPLITTQFIRSYVAAENGDFKHFNNSNGLLNCTPYVIEPISSSKYIYGKLYIDVPLPNDF